MQRSFLKLSYFAMLLALGNTATAEVTARLELERALPLEGISQPSGLAIHHGELLTVSDKVDDIVFRITLQESVAVATPYMRIDWQPRPRQGLDLEGICVGADGTLVLLGEARQALYIVEPPGRVINTIDFSDASSRGLFRTSGAGPEGVTMFGGQFLVCAERQPAGLLRMGLAGTGEQIFTGRELPLPVPASKLRPPDLTGLCSEGEQLWALSRNAECIVGLRLLQQQWTRTHLLDFADVSENPKYRYADARFGLAEGLALDRHRVYVVLDNNGQPRGTDSQDARPLLLVFRRPTWSSR